MLVIFNVVLLYFLHPFIHQAQPIPAETEGFIRLIPLTANGLTTIRAAGRLAVEPGNLLYGTTGTPTITSPVTTTFTISIGSNNCDAIVGQGDDVKLGELVYYVTNEIPANVGGGGAIGNVAVDWMNYYSKDLTIIGDKLRLDGYFDASVNVATDIVSFNPRLVNISGSNVKFWFSAMTTVNDYFETALHCIEWYSCRWMTEEVFRILKKKGFNMEASNLAYGKGVRKLCLLMPETVIKLFLMQIA